MLTHQAPGNLSDSDQRNQSPSFSLGAVQFGRDTRQMPNSQRHTQYETDNHKQRSRTQPHIEAITHQTWNHHFQRNRNHAPCPLIGNRKRRSGVGGIFRRDLGHAWYVDGEDCRSRRNPLYERALAHFLRSWCRPWGFAVKVFFLKVWTIYLKALGASTKGQW